MNEPWTIRLSAPLPEPVKTGNVYRWRQDVGTRSGVVMPKGSLIAVVEPTGQTPWDEIGPTGRNWLCAAANGVTVWATLEHCIERGLLERVP